MADGSAIEWTEATWNPITGCSVTSPGCTNCYAMRLAGTRLRNHPSRAGLTAPGKAGLVWKGKVRFNEQSLDQPLRWTRPLRIFVCARGDLFHPNVPDPWIGAVFNVMADAEQHTFQVLTKRTDRMQQVMSGPKHHGLWHKKLWHRSVLPNVWLGTSVDDQERADERIPHLLATPAAVRFISAEPLLGPIDITEHLWGYPANTDCDACPRDEDCECGWNTRAANKLPSIGWVIGGGESGPDARNADLAWFHSLRQQCSDAGVPYFQADGP